MTVNSHGGLSIIVAVFAVEQLIETITIIGPPGQLHLLAAR